ncbi:transporter substrate-binding domain-containing protein [Stappia sp. BW2]|uniref:transporter substrate-binding domain-containing protein n=1 Tax=Stappia sp. BW2 TaxID=2592622 RepID=UPI0011DE9D56|nr:transporter substrate-binding domain-containing protein [Stappia sp. BW2]TYC68964.1 transporter substrate-binding domain-containing protein [Stappia sp. BW2]
MRPTRRTIGLLLAAALAVVGTGPALAQSATQALSSESVIESIKSEGVIKVGVSLFKPWTMRDVNGDLIGFEIDVAAKLADDMGVDVEWIPTAWDGIIPALVSGQFDVIISGMSINPARNLTVNFTDPYAFSGQTILANTKMTEGFSLEDYNSPDVTFAVRRGAVAVEIIAATFPEAKVVQFDDEGAVIQEVLNGKAHAMMGSEPAPSTEARRYPDVVNVPFDYAFQATGEAFAIRKGDPDALNFFNNWIGVNTRNGWLKQRHNYWFRSDEWADQIPE